MRKLSVILAALFVVVGVASAAPVTKFFKEYHTSYNGGTNIFFDHKSHSVDRNRSCSYCHDMIKTYGGYVSSKDFIVDVTTKKVGHWICRECHINENTINGNSLAPTACDNTACHGNSLPASYWN